MILLLSIAGVVFFEIVFTIACYLIKSKTTT